MVTLIQFIACFYAEDNKQKLWKYFRTSATIVLLQNQDIQSNVNFIYKE